MDEVVLVLRVDRRQMSLVTTAIALSILPGFRMTEILKFWRCVNAGVEDRFQCREKGETSSLTGNLKFEVPN